MDTEFAKAIAEQIELTTSVIDAQAKTIADLQKTAAELQAQLGQQKTAAQAPVFDREAVNAALTKLVEARFIQAVEKEAFASRIEKDPAILLKMLKTAAEAEIGRVPRIGTVDTTPTAPPAEKASDQFWRERYG